MRVIRFRHIESISSLYCRVIVPKLKLTIEALCDKFTYSMKWQTIVSGIVGTLVVLFLLFFVLRSCSRSRSAPDTTGDLAESAFLTVCTADRETGLCFPQDPEIRDSFDHDAFMAMVREHQLGSSSSSSRRVVSPPEEPARTDDVPVAPTEPEIVVDDSDPFAEPGNTGDAPGNPYEPESTHDEFSIVSLQPACVDLTTGKPCPERGNDPDPGTPDDPADRWGLVRRSSLSGRTTASSPAGGNGGASGGSGGSGGPGGSGTRTETGSVIGGRGGLQGSVGPLPTGRCLRSRSLLSIFDSGQITTGSIGWTFPVLIDGSCPISAAILYGPDSGNGFGGPLNDF